MSDNKQLSVILEENQMENAEDVKKVFTPFFSQVDKMKKACNAIVITDISQVKEMEAAREYRLQLKKLRCAAEDEKSKLKEVPLRKCQAIDALARYLKSEIVPLEAHLKEQEGYVVRKEEERLQELETKRKTELDKHEADYEFVDLKTMPEENYQTFLSNAKESHKLRVEKDRREAEEVEKTTKAEAKRQEAVRLENEKLKKEAEEKEKEREVERKKEAETKKKVEAEHQAKLEKERKEREKVEVELKIKQQEEERKKKEEQDKVKAEEEAKKKTEKEAQLAPDKHKLEQLAVLITQIQMPEVKSEEAKRVIKSVVELLNKTSNYIKEKTITL